MTVRLFPDLDDAKVRLLQKALTFLESKAATHICYAVWMAVDAHARTSSNNCSTLTTAANEIRDYVLRSIGPYLFYDTWLLKNCPKLQSVSEDERKQAAREGRIAWVKHMIQLVQGGKPA